MLHAVFLVLFSLWLLLAVVMLVQYAAPDIYDMVIIRMTKVWYAEVLSRVAEDSKILDVGIGTGTALARNRDLVLQRNLSIVGLDYEAS